MEGVGENVLVGMLVDVTVPPDSPISFSLPHLSSSSPETSSKLDEDASNKENADGTIDSIEIGRSDDSDRRHSLTLSTPGILHHRILRDVTQKSTFFSNGSSPVVQMLEDEMFDFDFVLSPAPRRESKESEDDEEVFFGPVGFAERCVAESVRPEVKPLSPLSAVQIAELVKEAALVAYRLKADSKNSSSNDESSPAKKRHSRSGTFTLDNSPLKLLSLPIIETLEIDIDKPISPVGSQGNLATKGNTVTKGNSSATNGNSATIDNGVANGNKENLVQNGRKPRTPNGAKTRRSGLQPPAKTAKRSLQGTFKVKSAETKPDDDSPTDAKSKVAKPSPNSRLSHPVPTIKQALTSKIPDKATGLRRPVQKIQPPKTRPSLKVPSPETSINSTQTVPGNRSFDACVNRTIQPPKSHLSLKGPISTVNSSASTTVNKRCIQPPKSSAVKPDSSVNKTSANTTSVNKTSNTAANRRSLNATTIGISSRYTTPASSSERSSHLKAPGSSVSGLSRSYTISGPRPEQKSEIPGNKRPASKPSLLQPSQMQKKSIAVNSKRVSNGPMKAVGPPTINSRTVERKVSERRTSSSSGPDVSMSTPIKAQKSVHPKQLATNFSTPPSRSGCVSTSTPASATRKRSFLPTPNSSRTSSLGSIPPPSPLSYRSSSSTSSMGSVSDSPFIAGGRIPAGRRQLKKQSIGTYANIDEINENSPSALMPRKQRVVNTPNLPQRKISAWSPVQKAKPVFLYDEAHQCTKRTASR